MNDADFHQLADATLTLLFYGLEEADSSGKLDIEYENGIMTIELSGKRTLIVSKHTPSKQLWYSSPVAGGLHFSYNGTSKAWALGDGRELSQVLSGELLSMSGVTVRF